MSLNTRRINTLYNMHTHLYSAIISDKDYDEKLTKQFTGYWILGEWVKGVPMDLGYKSS